MIKCTEVSSVELKQIISNAAKGLYKHLTDIEFSYNEEIGKDIVLFLEDEKVVGEHLLSSWYEEIKEGLSLESIMTHDLVESDDTPLEINFLFIEQITITSFVEQKKKAAIAV